MKNKSLKLVPLNTLTPDELLEILKIRNQKTIREKMYTDHIISEDEHFKYVDRISKDCSACPFGVKIGDLIIGFASIIKINEEHKSADWTFWISEEHQKGGLGAQIEYETIEYAFFKLGLEKLNCEVISSNEKVIKMHEKFGFIIEGIRRKNIIKNGKREDVHFLGLTKDEWILNCGKFKKLFGLPDAV